MKAAVIGAGPAGLMAAERLAQAGLSVTLYEAKPSPARKFLMAGKSGLNLTFTGDHDKLVRGYGDAHPYLRAALADFDHIALRRWAEDLGQPTFVGTTGRVFPSAIKASPLLRAWLARLNALNVTLKRNHCCIGWSGTSLLFETPQGQALETPDVTLLACGGASWARLGSDGAWADWIDTDLTPFAPSNVGVTVDWSRHMAPHFGTALKSVLWKSGTITSRGEGILTASGFEGGGIYPLTPQLRTGANLTVDLLPDIALDTLLSRFYSKPQKTNVSKWLKSTLRLPANKVALVMEIAQTSKPETPADWCALLKELPIPIQTIGAMDKAISTAGGVTFDALDEGLMLRNRPGVFCAGEMLDWDAPTGGWLLTACFATGAWAGTHAARWAIR